MQKRAKFLICLVVLLPFFMLACSSVEMRVGDGQLGSFGHPKLKECPGVEFEITVTQGSQTVIVHGITAAGRATFNSGDLTDIDFSNIVKIELKVIKVPSNPGTAECPFAEGEIYETSFLVLTRVEEDTYGIDLDEFELQ